MAETNVQHANFTMPDRANPLILPSKTFPHFAAG
jgi:hypothetical protein